MNLNLINDFFGYFFASLTLVKDSTESAEKLWIDSLILSYFTPKRII